MKSSQTHKIYVVIGPTASGKSEFAVNLAKKVNGEIISADSRQVYRGLDIGTGKVEGKWSVVSGQWLIPTSHGRHKREYVYKKASLIPGPLSLAKDQNLKTKDSYFFVYKKIIHHCIDYINPKKQYSVADFKRDGTKAIQDILSRGKTPIICGGTGQFIDALVLDTNIPEVPPDLIFRKKMEQKTVVELFALLQKKDPLRAVNIDKHNSRRLIRALEIIHATKKPVPILQPKSAINNLQSEIYYLNPPREQLYKRIEKRLKERLKEGMITEVKNLHHPPTGKGLSWRRLDDLGLEYRYVSRYLRGLLTYEEMYTQLFSEIKKYSKRQQTWFKKYEKEKPD